MDFCQQSRDIMAEHGWKFGQTLRSDIHSKDHWETAAGGSTRAIGAGSSLYGRGGHCVLVDDYHGKIEQALSETERARIHKWFYGTILNRLEPNGSIIVVASRTHPKDLNGKLIEDGELGGDKYTRVSLPALAVEGDPLGRPAGGALWPERFSTSDLEAKRKALVTAGYPWLWDAMYQQAPPSVLDAEWPPDYFGEHIWFTGECPKPIWKVLALDPSVGATEKADYSAFIMLSVDADLNLWVTADLQRRDVFRIVDDGLNWYQRFQPNEFVVESNAFQAVLRPLFEDASKRRQMFFRISTINHTKVKKVERIRQTLTTPLAQHRMHFQRASPGARMVVDQLMGFPVIKHDDGPDGLEMAISRAAWAINGGLHTGAPQVRPEMERVRA